MSTGPDLRPLRRRLELGRLLLGSVVETVIKAYGAGAAVSVATSDAETVAQKAHAAIAAVPNLVDEYHDVRYVVEHREEIQGAVDYLDQNAPDQSELQAEVDASAQTLRDLETTFDELGRAKDAFTGLDVRDAFGSVRDAWGARPDLASLRDLAATAEQVGPLADRSGTLIDVYYRGLAAISDNFASEEVVSTVAVMVLALAIAFLLGRAVGFWIRRGRPGIVSLLLQRLGARVFRRWYVRNLPQALGPELYDVARERVQRDIVADPEQALDPEALAALEQHFARRESECGP